MIDLHTHILPGIDDGVKTEDEAVQFARMALADGTRIVTATPHCKEGFYFNDLSDVLSAVQRLEARLASEGVPLKLVPGAEVHICPDLTERIRDGRAPTLGNNGKTLLLELSLNQHPVELENLVFELKLAGIEIIFAHPERVGYFQDDLTRYSEVVRMGAYGQVTTGSILGLFGRVAAEFSEELLRKDLIHVLASDSHAVKGRVPGLSEALQEVIPLVGEARAQSMVESVPQALLAGHSPAIPPHEGRRPRKRSFLTGWFRRS